MFLIFDNEHVAKDNAGVALTHDEVQEAKNEIRKAADRIFKEYGRLPDLISIWLPVKPASLVAERLNEPADISPQRVTVEIHLRRDLHGQRFYVAVFRDKIA